MAHLLLISGEGPVRSRADFGGTAGPPAANEPGRLGVSGSYSPA